MNKPVNEIIVKYLWDEANCCCLLLSPAGIIRRANTHAFSLREMDLTGNHFDTLLVNFGSTQGFYPSLADSVEAQPFNLATNGLPRTYYFRFYNIEDGFLALGQLCMQQELMLQRNLLEMNHQMAEKIRQLQSQLAQP